MNLTVKEVLERYGPALAMIAALVGLVVFIPGNGDSSVATGTPGDTTAIVDGEDGGGLLDTGNAPLTSGGRLEGFPPTDSSGNPISRPGSTSGTVGGGTGGTTGGGGTAASSVWGPQHGPGNYPAPGPETQCRADGAMPDFSQYSNPCLPLFSGDNGGATTQGVTGDSVKVVWYRAETDPATQAALQGAGAGDTDEIIEHDIRTFMRFYNVHRETYGREVKLEIFQGTGPTDDVNVLRADAVSIAQNLKPFAVFHHSVAIGSEFSQELAARGVICVCTTSAPRSLYHDGAPYLYTILPVLDEYYTSIAEYVGKRLNGSPPKFAGAAPPGRAGFNDTRKFGLIFLEGAGTDVNPRIQPVVDQFKVQLAQYGAKLEIDIGYQYELGQAQAQSTNIMGQLINAGVNTVIFVGDPLYPIFLTQAASQQRYNPEWLITGTGLTDTTFFGRTYDQTQWSRAFGMSPLWVFAPLTETSGWNSHDHIDPGGRKGVGVNVTQAPIQSIFSGIHLAGPRLTPQTFADGLFAAPAVGGTINAPLVKFTQENPGALKDFVEVWWDGSRSGMDEQDRQGVGMLVKANGGTRYQTSQWPQQGPFAFGDDPDPITTTDLPEIFPHDEDGHTHDADPPCRSCG